MCFTIDILRYRNLILGGQDSFFHSIGLDYLFHVYFSDHVFLLFIQDGKPVFFDVTTDDFVLFYLSQINKSSEFYYDLYVNYYLNAI